MAMSGESVGKLDKAMYGTRDAPAMWQEHLENTFSQVAFRGSAAAPCVYFHPELNVCAVAHVDDVLFEVSRPDLDEVLVIMKKTYKVKAEFIGPNPEKGEVREGRFLGRKITWEEDGITWSGDDRLVAGMLKDWNLSEANAAVTPGTTDGERVERQNPMGKTDSAKY